jgi:hypothetical protein
MLNTEEYKLLIESYLAGDLSAEQTTQFEKEISENPRLQNEVSLQKSIITAIQSGRKAELKARLNNLDVAVSTGLKAWHYASIIGVVSLLGVTGYYLFPFKDKQEPVVVSVLSPKQVEEGKVPSKDQEEVLESESNSSDLPSSTKNAATVSTSAKQNTVSGNTASDARSKEEVPSLPDLNTPEGAVHEPLNKEIENPQHGLGKTSHLGTSVPGVEVVKSKKHPFHYRYFDNKLFLYGNFETKTYVILELNTAKGQEFYLKFDANYYDLETNKTEISKLELVKDAHILSQLEEVQKK